MSDRDILMKIWWSVWIFGITTWIGLLALAAMVLDAP